MKNLAAIFLITLFALVMVPEAHAATNGWWEVQAIDTVKDSRDKAKERKNDPNFADTIDLQLKSISEIGATHVSLGTPYDEEFYPFLKLWIAGARKHNLKIWFRGNFSGWENWFDYPSISKEDHQKKIKKFIEDNRDLFESGDIFTPCTECENGVIGDPRDTGDVEGFRQFFIEEYRISREAFRLTGNNVSSNYFPMNGDVAKLVMDPKTTQALGGIVVIDHYVKSADQLSADVKELAEKSRGKIVLGEIGAPIPDIHGDFTADQQAQWITDSLTELAKINAVVGVNYWTGFNSTTQVWNNSGKSSKSVEVLKSFFKPMIVSGKVVNELNKPIKNVEIITEAKTVHTDSRGFFELPILPNHNTLQLKATGYKPREYVIVSETMSNILTLKKEKEGILFKLQKYILSLM